MVRDYLNDQIDEMRCIEAICIFARLEIKVMVLDSNQSNGEFSVNHKAFDVSSFHVVNKPVPFFSQNTTQSHPGIPFIPKVNLINSALSLIDRMSCIVNFWPPNGAWFAETTG
jgi:hypothetical protein